MFFTFWRSGELSGVLCLRIPVHTIKVGHRRKLSVGQKEAAIILFFFWFIYGYECIVCVCMCNRHAAAARGGQRMAAGMQKGSYRWWWADAGARSQASVYTCTNTPLWEYSHSCESSASMRLIIFTSRTCLSTLELEFQAVARRPMLVLGTEPGPSGRPVYSLNCWATSPAPMRSILHSRVYALSTTSYLSQLPVRHFFIFLFFWPQLIIF